MSSEIIHNVAANPAVIQVDGSDTDVSLNLVTKGAGTVLINGAPISASTEWGDITGTLSDQTDLQSALDGKSDVGHNHDSSYIPLSQKGAASGVASLDAGSKIPQSQLPAIAITDTFVVASQAAMLALSAETGDVAVRTDLNKSFILQGSNPATLAHWQELLTPTSAVSSVDGRTGVVTLNDLYAPISHTHTTSDITNLSSYTGFDSRYFTESEITAGYQPLDADLTAIAALSANGIIRKTAGTYAMDSATYLTGNQSITLSGDASGTGSTAITVTLGNSGVAAGTYNDVATQVRPFTVDVKGRVTSIGTAVTIAPAFSSITSKPTTLSGYGITDGQPLDADLTAIAALSANGIIRKTAGTYAMDSASYLTGNQSITLSGDASGTGSTAITVTLANSGVSAGTYNNVATEVRPFTVDAKGRLTAIGTAVTIAPAFSSITSKPTTLSGYGITDGQPLDADLTAIAALSANGIIRKTAGTYAMDSSVYLTDIVQDTTPQLGGNLDVNTYSIVSVSNGNVNITPNGTGKAAITNLEAAIPLNTQTGTTYTAVLADADKFITLSNASAITMTIPANSSVAYPVGTKLNFMQLGAGQVTVSITTDTLSYNADLTAKLAGQYSVATAVKITSTSWVLFGDLEAL